jgi:hypothetical protein
MAGEIEKKKVLTRLAAGRQMVSLPKSKAKVGNNVVHMRFRSSPKGNSSTWSFNINPNTLTGDFELWICGSASLYYLIPITSIKAIYEDESAYVDYAHPEIRVLDIDSSTHQCFYGKGRNADFASFFHASLE